MVGGSRRAQIDLRVLGCASRNGGRTSLLSTSHARPAAMQMCHTPGHLQQSPFAIFRTGRHDYFQPKQHERSRRSRRIGDSSRGNSGGLPNLQSENEISTCTRIAPEDLGKELPANRLLQQLPQVRSKCEMPRYDQRSSAVLCHTRRDVIPSFSNGWFFSIHAYSMATDNGSLFVVILIDNIFSKLSRHNGSLLGQPTPAFGSPRIRSLTA